LGVDLRSAEGVQLVRELAAHADVVVESFRPGVAARLALGADDLRSLNHRLVYCSITGYGQTGPYASWAGHDLNWLGVGGYLALTGRGPDGVPVLPGAVVADAAGGMCAAFAIVAALVGRGVTGTGAYLDVAVLEAVLRITSVSLDQHLGLGHTERHGAGELFGGAPHYGVYRTADDRFVTVAAIEPAFFANLCRAMGLDDLVDVQRSADQQPNVRRALISRFATRTRDEWVALLGPLDCCVAPVYELDEIAADRHIQHRGIIWRAPHDELGSVVQLSPALTAAPRPEQPPVLRDLRSTNPEQVLAEIGLSASDIATLRVNGVIS
jgi:alpha-methylacyl-CoA racemase